MPFNFNAYLLPAEEDASCNGFLDYSLSDVIDPYRSTQKGSLISRKSSCSSSSTSSDNSDSTTTSPEDCCSSQSSNSECDGCSDRTETSFVADFTFSSLSSTGDDAPETNLPFGFTGKSPLDNLFAALSRDGNNNSSPYSMVIRNNDTTPNQNVDLFTHFERSTFAQLENESFFESGFRKRSVSCPQTHSNRRRKVRFADDIGLPLTTVRLLPNNQQQQQYTTSSLKTNSISFHLNFKQPAANFTEFADKLMRQCVALENVLIRSSNVLGTIKVQNLAYQKEVRVRVTRDDWITYNDIRATYVPCLKRSPSDSDIFTFQVSLTDCTEHVQFAICYETNGQQHWDNNGGVNYKIIREVTTEAETSPEVDSQLNCRTPIFFY